MRKIIIVKFQSFSKFQYKDHQLVNYYNSLSSTSTCRQLSECLPAISGRDIERAPKPASKDPKGNMCCFRQRKQGMLLSNSKKFRIHLLQRFLASWIKYLNGKVIYKANLMQQTDTFPFKFKIRKLFEAEPIFKTPFDHVL